MNQHKTMKVWGWIAAFLFAPVGIVLGLMLRKRRESIGTWIGRRVSPRLRHRRR